MMATFYASKVTQDWLFQEVFRPVVGHSSACLAGTGVQSDGQISVAFGWHLACRSMGGLVSTVKLERRAGSRDGQPLLVRVFHGPRQAC